MEVIEGGRDDGLLYPYLLRRASVGVYTPARAQVDSCGRFKGSSGVSTSTIRGYAAMALRRPTLIPSLLRASWRFRARDWWRRPPFLPLPPKAYVDWRNETAFGAPDARTPPDLLARYLHWTESMRR
ncbi:MAG: hypothetical protein GX539_03435 [Candidatus Cloacimonetes bacterium]|nr:hypothetical protein [Candidatus Cloacimonadota bacterium]